MNAAWRPRVAAAGSASLVMTVLLVSLLEGQESSHLEQPERSSAAQATVLLITVGPEPDVRSAFGHAMLQVIDPNENSSRAYSYGLSSDQDPSFIRALIRGSIRSRAIAGDAREMLEHYAAADRDIWVQRLNLSPAQTRRLLGILRADTAPGAPLRLHDFYSENCTTALRDALDEATEGQLRTATSRIAAAGTLRGHTLAHLWGEAPLLYAALSVVLGSAADRPLSVWQEMFMPSLLRQHVRSLTIQHENGERWPLVVAEESWYRSERSGTVETMPLLWPLWLGVGMAAAAAIAFLGKHASQERWARRGFALVGGVWLCAVGVLGLLVAVLWGVARQPWASANAAILVIHPVALVTGWMMLTGSLLLRSERKWLAQACWVMALFGLVAALTAVVISSELASIVLATLPPYLALAWALRVPAMAGATT